MLEWRNLIFEIHVRKRSKSFQDKNDTFGAMFENMK